MPLVTAPASLVKRVKENSFSRSGSGASGAGEVVTATSRGQDGSDGSRQVDVDLLRLEVGVERVRSELTTDAALLEAAPHGLARRGLAVVDPHDAGPHGPSGGEGAADVTGPDRRRQPVLGVVAHPDDLVDVGERQHGHDGTEDLLAGDAQLVRARLEDGRRDEVAPRQGRVVGSVALVAEPGLAPSDLDVALDPLLLLARDERSHRRRRVKPAAEAD